MPYYSRETRLNYTSPKPDAENADNKPIDPDKKKFKFFRIVCEKKTKRKGKNILHDKRKFSF